MNTDLQDKREGAAVAPDLAQTLAYGIERVMNARTVYGEAVTHDGVTVIPVACASWLGAGGGDRGVNEGGSGLVGALRVKPVGYIEIKDGETRFKGFFDMGVVVQIILSYSVVAAITFAGVRKIIQASRSKS
jgi:uncharacterized spore protein YtfJ